MLLEERSMQINTWYMEPDVPWLSILSLGHTSQPSSSSEDPVYLYLGFNFSDNTNSLNNFDIIVYTLHHRLMF